MHLLVFLLILVSSLPAFGGFLVSPVSAQCPVCVVTVGGGMLLAKQLGVDDLLVSIWISALNTVLSFWLAPKMKWRWLKNPVIFSVLMYAFTLVYFLSTGQLTGSANSIFGLNKILLGTSLGLLAVLLGNHIYVLTKRRNSGRALFPYSKVVFPVAATLLITLLFKFAFNL